jgi:hypothetical protein
MVRCCHKVQNRRVRIEHYIPAIRDGAYLAVAAPWRVELDESRFISANILVEVVWRELEHSRDGSDERKSGKKKGRNSHFGGGNWCRAHRFQLNMYH